MRTQQIILLAGTAAAASIQGDLAVANQERDLTACTKAAEALLPKLTGIPTPDSKLQAFIAQQTWATGTASATDECEIPQVTGDPKEAKAYTEWINSFTSWYDDNKSEVLSVVKICTDTPEIQSALSQFKVPAVGTTCESVHWAKETGSAKSGSKSGSSSGTKSSSSKSSSSSAASSAAATSDKPASATRPSGLIAGIVGLAGVAFAAML